MKKPNLFFLFFLFSMHFTLPILGELSYAQQSALGELLTVQSTPIAQLDFTYNVNAFFAEENFVGSGFLFYANGAAILQTGGLGSATLSSKIRAYAQPGLGFSSVFAAIYSNGDIGTSQIAGIGNDTDGFFFQWENGIFGILYRNNSVDTTIPQSNWNVDPMDGTGPSGVFLNYANGNIFTIQYQQLEFGNIKFFIESPLLGQPILVHQIEYANANTSPSISNPGLQLMAQVTSSGGMTELQVSSMGLILEGELNPYLGIRNNVSSNASVSTTTSNVLTIQDNEIFSSMTNQLMVIPDQLSLFNSSTSGEDAIFSLYLNPTVGGSPAFTNVNSNSIVSYDTNGTTVSGGTLVGTFFLSSGSNLSINLGKCGIRLSPGDQLVIACQSANVTINVDVSVSWLEQF